MTSSQHPWFDPVADAMKAALPASTLVPQRFRSVLSHFCTGVTVITALHEDLPYGLTCQSFTSLSLEPPLVLVCPSRSSKTWPVIEAVGSFAVNVLSQAQGDLCRSFAVSGADKFSGVSWLPAPETGSPLLPGSLAWIDCRLETVHDGGDHVIAVARVVALDHVSEPAEPLLFFRGGFGVRS